jgi:hypothetical protein
MRTPVQVECYSGGRADERPSRVRDHEREYIVARLLSSEFEEDCETRQRSRRFTMLTTEGLTLDLLKAVDGTWYLEKIS